MSQMTFEPDPKRVEHARRVTGAHLKRFGVDPDAIETVRLLASEIVTNAVIHGKGESVTFTLIFHPHGEVRIEVDDHSPGSPVVRDPGPDEEGGRGLRLVDFLSRDWGRTGTCTWCVVPVNVVSA
ncbi:ATP-binding protein [Streptomyces sp. SID10815]|nr:ATP-binding protein [Streptomyces sp. SID10815]